jgi:hypothetical protein
MLFIFNLTECCFLLDVTAGILKARHQTFGMTGFLDMLAEDSLSPTYCCENPISVTYCYQRAFNVYLWLSVND